MSKVLNPIVDVMGGVDGGIAFVKLRTFLEGLENNPDDLAGQEILKQVQNVSNLFKYFLEN